MKTTVVHKNEPHDVYIGRPGPWGNPFVIGRDGDRDEVIAKFAEWFENSGDPRAANMRRNVHLLKGRRLGCFCAPRACHGDVLAEAADKE